MNRHRFGFDLEFILDSDSWILVSRKTARFCKCIQTKKSEMIMVHSSIKIILFGLSLLLVLAGCGDIDSGSRKALKRFGPAMDAKRTELKLLPVPKDARINLLTSTSLAWITSDPDACHVSKTIVYNQEVTVLVSEMDEVQSPRSLSSTMTEEELAKARRTQGDPSRLVIVSTFSPDGQTVVKQAYNLSQGEKTTHPTAEEAEKLLAAWGIR